MRLRRATLLTAVAIGGAVLVCRAAAEGEAKSPFAPGALQTSSGRVADTDWYYEPEVCGECHVAQYADWKGSLHSRSHQDALYLAFARRARAEGGDDLYRFCSSCHAPGAVATGEIPAAAEDDHTFLTNDGVSCDVCHSVSRVETRHAGGGANGSIVLEEGEVRFGPLADPASTPAHESKYSETHTQSRFCSACHSLTHPTNGAVIENTYEEWAQGPYAAAGIQCQDCHMRTVAQAIEVARTMKPLRVPGESVENAQRPNTYAHLFVGGNVNAALTGSSERHATEADARLRSAATVALELPAALTPGKAATLAVAVTNVAAGHCIPTSITELRQAWLDVRIADKTHEIFRSGALTETGAIGAGTVVYGATLHDADGKVTYLPWRAVSVASETLLHPKQTRRETFTFTPPADAAPPYTVHATLRYRSAPQDVLDDLFGKDRLRVRVVDMATAVGTIEE